MGRQRNDLIRVRNAAISHPKPGGKTVRSAMLRHTQLFNLTGHPAISLPLKTSGLPVGLQLVGARHQTATLLSVVNLGSVSPVIATGEGIGRSGGQEAAGRSSAPSRSQTTAREAPAPGAEATKRGMKQNLPWRSLVWDAGAMG